MSVKHSTTALLNYTRDCIFFTSAKACPLPWRLSLDEHKENITYMSIEHPEHMQMSENRFCLFTVPSVVAIENLQAYSAGNYTH